MESIRYIGCNGEIGDVDGLMGVLDANDVIEEED